MGGFDIYLGNFQIALDHVEGGVSEHLFKGEDISAIAKELDGKCVTKTVRVDVWDV